MAGTFLKTPDVQVVEVLALSGLDFICIDGEHSAFDRGRMDACLAVARALDFPTLVRVGSNSAENVLQALDSGAVGVVAPHVDSVAKAEALARSARFGLGGRGYAGSTRWAGYTTRGMDELLARSREETVVIAQIEEPAGVDAAAEIAAVEGIDGLFVGPADLTVAYGAGPDAAQRLRAAMAAVGGAAREAGKAAMTFVPTADKAADWMGLGMTMFFIASEQAWILNGARAEAEALRKL